jgi:hypothetical protein
MRNELAAREEGIFEGERNFLCLDCGHDYMIAYTLQNSSNCAIRKGDFYFI